MPQPWMGLVGVPVAEPAAAPDQMADRTPLMVRMSDFTSQPAEWTATARQRPVVLLRHGRPVGLLRPALPQPGEQQLEVTMFGRHAKESLAAGRAHLTRYGEPYHVAVEPVAADNFDGWVLARSDDLMSALENTRGKARSSAEVAADLGLPYGTE